MAETLGYKKRVKFARGKQKHFLQQAQDTLSLSTTEVAKLIDVHPRSLRDWKREKLLMSWPAAKQLSKLSGISLPGNYEIKDPFWYVNKGAKAGWATLQKRYGGFVVDEEYRKKRWKEWWNREGKFKPNPIMLTKSIKKPRFSQDLAEFTGIMIGDGGILSRRLTVSLNSEVDKEYALFVIDLIGKLFDAPVSLYRGRMSKVIHIRVFRTELVKYCKNILGLHVGNKLEQGLDIPEWIHQKKSYEIACVRGLVDTDGCVFHEKHKINGKVYSYARLNFTTASPALAASVIKILKSLGFSPTLRRKGRAVQLENKEEIRHYFEVVGSSNPKHRGKIGLIKPF